MQEIPTPDQQATASPTLSDLCNALLSSNAVAGIHSRPGKGAILLSWSEDNDVTVLHAFELAVGAVLTEARGSQLEPATAKNPYGVEHVTVEPQATIEQLFEQANKAGKTVDGLIRLCVLDADKKHWHLRALAILVPECEREMVEKPLRAEGGDALLDLLP